jgi:type IV pilus assembly protein PilE
VNKFLIAMGGLAVCPAAPTGRRLIAQRERGPSYDSIVEKRSRKMSASRQQGLSLIELMVVVSILGILAGVGYPSYMDHVTRGRVMEGTSTLADLRVRLEQFYQDNRIYGSGSCGNDGTTQRVAFPDTKYFTYSCALGTGGQSYTITAASRAATSGGANGDWSYTIDNQNQRATTKFKGASSSATCWQVKKGEACS